MKNKFFPLALAILGNCAYAQFGIGTLEPNISTQLDVVSQDRGILIPRVSLTSRTDSSTITSGNTNSLLVFNITDNSLISPGFYYWYNDVWQKLINSSDLTEIVDSDTGSINLEVVNDKLHLDDVHGNSTDVLLTDINLPTNLINNNDGSYTYVNEFGTSTIIDIPSSVVNNFEEIVSNTSVLNTLVEYLTNTSVGGNLTYNGSVFSYLDSNNLVQNFTIPDLETTTQLTISDDQHSFTYINEDGESVTVNLLAGERGIDGKSAFEIWEGLPGNDGKSITEFLESLRGEMGSIGLTGLTGDQGPAGPIGEKGNTGASGPAGAMGPAGPEGPVGATGPEGPVGEAGPAGPEGPAGPTGPIGPEGPQGPQGPIGPAGPVGPVGPQGLTGATGPSGPVGATGATGPAGIGGKTVAAGAIHLTGLGTNLDPYSISVKVGNGLSIDDDKVKLGGTLNEPITLTTSSVNTLSLKGLSKGSTSDKIVVTDSNGVVKSVKAVTPSHFNLPSVVLPTSNTNLPSYVTYTTGVFTVDLYDLYSKQFGMVGNVVGTNRSAIRSANATSTLPVFSQTDLEYFVTYFDNTVYNPLTITLSDQGILSYTIVPSSTPSTKTYMNIVFKVK